jgi:glycosyltransferase involved in cell wall biosynthesis
MNVWLFTVGEPLPTDPGIERLFRTGHLAQTLADLGHEVMWWTSSFDHVRKVFRVEGETTFAHSERLRIRYVPSPGYAQNISLARVWDHLLMAMRIASQIREESDQPDVVVASLPTPEIAAVVAAWGASRGIPVVVDVRDLWPDVFESAFPARLRDVAPLFLAPFRALSRLACSRAAALTGHAPAFVEWGAEMAGRPVRDQDRSFPHGYFSKPPLPEEQEAADGFWDALGVQEGEFLICYFGAIGHQFDLDVVLDAAHLLRDRVRFVLCGSGDRLEHYRARAAQLENVVFPGWVDRPRIWSLMRRSRLGIAPYIDRKDFRMTISNKIPEYLSEGLPILLSLPAGYLHDLLTDAGAGISYSASSRKLARLIEGLADSPPSLEAMSDRARALFTERFEGGRVYGEFAAYLEQIHDSGRRGD